MLRTTMILTALTTAAATAAPAATAGEHAPATPRYGPGVRVWISGGDLHERNDRIRVYYRTERGAFVTVFRVDTDGRVRVLFPRRPDDDNWAEGGATYSVSNWDRGVAFVVDDYPGVGYVFAAASSEPFDYRVIEDYGRWDVHAISDGRVHGDPRAALEALVGRLLPDRYDDFETHLAPYYVERRYDYPRFVCYDCHAYVPFYTWDPYRAWCRRFTLVVWSDPWYYYPSYRYPVRYYGGSRVVYTYPNAAPRYVFKDRDGAPTGVDYRRRDLNDIARRPDDRGVGAVSVGGVGAVPAPRMPSRRVAPDLPRRTDDVSPWSAPARRSPGGADSPDQRRRAESAAPGGRTDPPADVPRRRTAEPGIEIVPAPGADRRRAAEPGTGAPSRTGNPGEPSEARRRPEAEPNAPRPATAQPEREPRRAEPREAPRAERERPQAEPREAPRPERERPQAEPRRAPESRPEPPRPRSEPAARPANPPAGRPAPQARPAEAPPREAPRPAGGLQRRRPD